MPICGIVPSRGWQIISVALEPKCFGDYCEAWDLIINKVQKTRISFTGNAEMSQVEVMSHGFHPGTHAMLEFPPTITGCTNYCTAYLHNLTRMDIHIRVLCSVDWLGADDCGSLVLPPKEILYYHWWFFPKNHDKIYETTITLSCVCLIDGRPVGEPTEVFIAISGYSEFPDLRILPRRNNLHDIVVGESSTIPVTLYNKGSCFYTSKLYYIIDGMGDDFSGDRLQIDSAMNSLKPSNHCEVLLTVTPDGAGSRQLSIKYTVLFRTEYGEIEEIQPITRTICTVWYDGIYPTIKVYLSAEHLTIPIMPTHSLSRDIISIYNDTDHIMRFIWLPERIANILNVVMTPCWGTIQPKSAEWITMTVYTLQEPATFTTTVACEILDLTNRKHYQQNELLRRNKIEKCNEEFIITEKGMFHPELNDSPPYVLDLEKPQPMYLAMTVSISSKGQRDGYPRMHLRQMWEQPPPYDLLSADLTDYVLERPSGGNSMTLPDILRIIDGILWDAMHSKMFRNQIQYYSKEEIPVLEQVMKVANREKRSKLSRRVTSGICDAIVNKAVFHTYGLNPKQISILEAE